MTTHLRSKVTRMIGSLLTAVVVLAPTALYGADQSASVDQLRALVTTQSAQIASLLALTDELHRRVSATEQTLQTQQAALTAQTGSNAAMQGAIASVDNKYAQLIGGVRVYQKGGNNGTTSCDNFCEDPQGVWGERGSCVGGYMIADPTRYFMCSETIGAAEMCLCVN